MDEQEGRDLYQRLILLITFNILILCLLSIEVWSLNYNLTIYNIRKEIKRESKIKGNKYFKSFIALSIYFILFPEKKWLIKMYPLSI